MRFWIRTWAWIILGEYVVGEEVGTSLFRYRSGEKKCPWLGLSQGQLWKGTESCRVQESGRGPSGQLKSCGNRHVTVVQDLTPPASLCAPLFYPKASSPPWSVAECARPFPLLSQSPAPVALLSAGCPGRCVHSHGPWATVTAPWTANCGSWAPGASL